MASDGHGRFVDVFVAASTLVETDRRGFLAHQRSLHEVEWCSLVLDAAPEIIAVLKAARSMSGWDAQVDEALKALDAKAQL